MAELTLKANHWYREWSKPAGFRLSGPPLYWRWSQHPHKLELQVGDHLKKNSGLQLDQVKRHFHVHMCWGTSLLKSEFFLPCHILSPCLTEAWIFLWHLEPNDAGLLAKGWRVWTHGFLLLALQWKGNFCQTPRLFFTVCHLQWEEKACWPGSPGLKNRKRTVF